jgi:hypothetical protein
LNNQSHQRNDIGPRETFRITTDAAAKNFERIASINPYSIHYSLGSNYDTPEMKTIWSRITTLRELTFGYRHCDTSQILTTQTGLTSLSLQRFSPQIQHCTNLLELTTLLPLISDYHYISSSLTKLDLVIEHAKLPHDDEGRWSFADVNVIAINNHFPHLAHLELDIESDVRQFVKPGALSSLSRLSITKLTIQVQTKDELTLLNGLVHHGWFSI